MEQTVSTALITAIIAVVLGALGLIGGVVGYVQGTAALRRATLTRQRAATAEEAALQARTQAEQAARTAQSVLDRLTGLRSAADVADLPTGPLVLPPRAAPPVASSTASESGASSSLIDLDSQTVTAEATPELAPTGTQPAESSAVAGSADPAESSDAEPRVTEPMQQQSIAAPEGARAQRAGTSLSEGTPLEPTSEVPVREDQDSGPVAFASLRRPDQRAEALEGPSAAGISEEPSVEVTTAVDTSSGLAETPEITEPATSVEEPAAASEVGFEGDGRASAGPGADDDEQPASLSSEPPVSQRSSTGQITAGTRGTAPMDWAEALRTGAIPLPARSRGTYAAPSKAKGQPVGPARFEIRAVGRQRYEAVNVGGATAEQASLEGAGDDNHLVRPVEARPKPVMPGGALAFSVLRVEGRDVSVRITWMLNGDEEQAELPVP